MNDELDRLLACVGAGLFLRYRKRFFEPGIANVMARCEPGLSIGDALEKVRAARRIINQGLTMEAVARARRGGTAAYPGEVAIPIFDPTSEMLVFLGAFIAGLYVVIALI